MGAMEPTAPMALQVQPAPQAQVDKMELMAQTEVTVLRALQAQVVRMEPMALQVLPANPAQAGRTALRVLQGQQALPVQRARQEARLSLPIFMP